MKKITSEVEWRFYGLRKDYEKTSRNFKLLKK